METKDVKEFVEMECLDEECKELAEDLRQFADRVEFSDFYQLDYRKFRMINRIWSSAELAMRRILKCNHESLERFENKINAIVLDIRQNAREIDLKLYVPKKEE